MEIIGKALGFLAAGIPDRVYLWLSSLSLADRLISIAFVILVSFLARGLVRAHIRPHVVKVSKLLALVLAAVVLACPHHEVYATFSSIYNSYKKELGLPIAAVEPLRSPDDVNRIHTNQPWAAHQFFHERAMLLFLNQSDDLFILPNVPEEHLQARRIVGSYIPWQKEWYTYADLRKRFQVPADPDLHPPYGGVAWYWFHTPGPWESTLGWQVWNCAYKSNLTYSQRFEHGTVYGVFRVYTPELKANPDGQALILLNDKSFYWQRTSEPAAACEAKLDDGAKQPDQVRR